MKRGFVVLSKAHLLFRFHHFAIMFMNNSCRCSYLFRIPNPLWPIEEPRRDTCNKMAARKLLPSRSCFL